MAAGRKTGGRKKGTPNKVTAQAKDAIAYAGDALGGGERLVAWVKESPENERVFWAQIYTKLIPHQLETGPAGFTVNIDRSKANVL